MSIVLLTAESIDELSPFKKILDAKGVVCELKKENLQVHKFYTKPGAVLYIADTDLYDAQKIISKYGANQQDASINIGLEHSREELMLKRDIRNLIGLLLIDKYQKEYKPTVLNFDEVMKIFNEEKKYINHRNANKFDLNEFLAHLFEGRLFQYLNRNKSTKYEIENELIAELDK